MSEPIARCDVCPHRCAITEGSLGLCRARVARGGEVVSQNYGRVSSLALDPIEKKPIACWHSGSTVLSVGSYGCNMNCSFCQNASIAQVGSNGAAWREVTPEQLVLAAIDARSQGCIGIAFTYNEPLVGYEYVRDTAVVAHESGLKTVLVSNGMINARVLSEFDGLIDAANIDLKAFREESYLKLGGDFETVKATISMLSHDQNCHLEVTTLVVPGFNDDKREIEDAAAWLAGVGDCGEPIPYHLTRFFPRNRLTDRNPTPIRTLENLKRVAERHLDAVLLGNC